MKSLAMLVLWLWGVTVIAGDSLCLTDVTVDLRSGSVQGSVTSANGFTWVDKPQENPCNAGCGLRGLLKITFDTSRRKHLQINMTFDSNPSGFTFNIGDSISNNGYDGDDYHQSNNAEVHSVGRTIFFYGREMRPSRSYGLLYQRNNFITHEVKVDIMDELAAADNGHDYLRINSFKTFALNGQADARGPVNYDIYLALNRVVTGRPDRYGNGLCKVSIGWVST